MKIDERTFAQIPPKLQALFRRLPNPAKAEVLQAFARFPTHSAGAARAGSPNPREAHRNGAVAIAPTQNTGLMHRFGDTGTAARFFFCGKATADERVGSHPTVKPVALMEWLVTLVTPPTGRVLDPFCGTGSTLVACDRLGFDALGIEQDAQTVADAHEKIRRLRARRAIGPVDERPVPMPGQQELAL